MSAFICRIIRRQIATTLPTFSDYAATTGEHSASHKLWKQITFLVGFPCVGLCMLNAWLKHQEDHHKPRPELKKYEYLSRRDKRGDDFVP